MTGLLSGCLLDNDRDDIPALVFYPESARQGELISVRMSAEGMSFDQCDALTPESLVFTGPLDNGKVTVHGIDIVTNEVLRGYVYIDDEAAIGAYQPSLRCNALTTLTGEFNVLRRGDVGLALEIVPGSAPAGAINQRLVLRVDSPIFDEDTSYVVFGDGSTITIDKQRFISEKEIELNVDISPTAFNKVSDKELIVSVATGSKLVYGKFQVTERIDPTIWVQPSEVERPGTGTLQYSLTIEGVGVGFLAPQPDAGTDDESASTCSFPENPGIIVTAVDVIDEKTISANIKVNEGAEIGSTPLLVTTGEHEAWTNFTIKLVPGQPYIKIIDPWKLPSDGNPHPKFAEAVNFAFQNVQRVECLETGCAVKQFVVSPAPFKRMTLTLSVDADFEGESATLQVETLDHTVQAMLNVVEAQDPALVPNPKVITQGSKSTGVQLKLNGTSFVPEATANVLSRSGIKIRVQDVGANLTTLYLLLDIAHDAPVGAAMIGVVNGTEQLEVPIEIQASGQIPWLTLFPQTTLQERGTTVLELDAHDFEFIEGIDNYAFDDSQIRVINVVVDADDSHSAQLTIDVSPVARPDMTVLYVTGADNKKAAATFRILDVPHSRVVDVVPDEVARGNNQIIQVWVENLEFDAVIAQVPSGIGVEVSRVWIGAENSMNVSFSLDVDETGPGGWIGVLLSGGGGSVVVPVFIDAGGDDSLTMRVSPDAVYNGTLGQALNVTLPEEIPATSGVFDVRAGEEGLYCAGQPLVTGDQNVKLWIDVIHGASAVNNSVPLILSSTKGAAVGFLDIVPRSTIKVSESAEWQGTLSTGEVYVATVELGPEPSMIYSSFGRQGYADVKTDLIAPGRLDVAASSESGFLWVADQSEKVVAVVSAMGSVSGSPATVGVKSFGGRATDEKGPEESLGTNDPGFEILVDPCVTPFLGRGTIDGALDVDLVDIKKRSCQLALIVMAREVTNRPWETPDPWLDLCQSTEQIDCTRVVGWPTNTDPDPRIYLSPDDPKSVLGIGAEHGTAGLYLLNIRRPNIIAEFSRGLVFPFIEIETDPASSLDALSVELVDCETRLVLDSYSFNGSSIANDGRIVISGVEMPGADVVSPVAVMPDEGAFAIRLLESGVVVDAVQVGSSSVSFGEGASLVDIEDYPVYFRAGGIDTNDNRGDFIGGWVGTPGNQ
jgi:hypothetical protein